MTTSSSTSPALSEDDRIEGVACSDCATWIANRDDSGSDPDWDRSTANATLEQYTVAIGEGTQDFSKSPCSVCDSRLAGQRYEVSMWENQ